MPYHILSSLKFNFACLLMHLLVYLARYSNASLQVAHFSDNALIHASKCCDNGDYLIVQQIEDNLITYNNTPNKPSYKSVNCGNYYEPINPNIYQIVSKSISKYAKNGICAQDLDCVDFARIPSQKSKAKDDWKLFRLFRECKMEEIKDFNFFPKCCPPKYVYQLSKHKCVPTSQNLTIEGLQVMKIGLSDCPVYNHAIIDIPSVDFEIDKENKQLKLSEKSFNYNEFCLDNFETQENIGMDYSSNLIRICTKTEDVCTNNNPCIWKCCPDGQIYVKNNSTNFTKKCLPSLDAEINLNLIPKDIFPSTMPKDFAIISANYPLKQGYTQYKHRAGMHFKLKPNGDVETEIDHIIRHFDAHEMVYCIELFKNPNSTVQTLFRFHFEVANVSNTLKCVILLVSAIFAFLTILCYAILPEMQNVHGKCIMMECFFLLLGSIILCYTNMKAVGLSQFCTILGYGTIFAFLGLFAWLNIICVDMWMTFGVLRGFKVKNRKSELKKFFIYSAYGFGVPILLVGFMAIAQNAEFLPENWTPKIGNKRCYFDSNTTLDYMIYFLTPMALMLLINILLFVKTILYCFKVKNEIQKMRDNSTNEKTKRKNTFKEDKEKMMMLLKLFLIMGIPWIFEVISSLIWFKKVWIFGWLEIIFDTINSAKGIIIFCIFILKKNVLTLLATKFGIKTAARRSTELTSLTMTTHTH